MIRKKLLFIGIFFCPDRYGEVQFAGGVLRSISRLVAPCRAEALREGGYIRRMQTCVLRI